MVRSLFRIAEQRKSVALTVATTILLSTFAGARQQHKSGGAQSSPPPTVGPTGRLVDLSPKNKLVFPYGRQTFEKRENLPTGSSVGDIPGWRLLGSPNVVATTIVENTSGFSAPGTPKRWLSVEDHGASVSEGFITPLLTAPSPWNYAWNFRIKVVTAPASDLDTPVLAIQHKSGNVFPDTWGVRLNSTGAELYVASNWGPSAVEPLFAYAGATSVGEWVQVRIVASLATDTLRAFVNGVEVVKVRTHPQPWMDLTNLRLSYHGSGAGNPSSILLDEVGIAFLNPLCQEDVLIDFTNEDDGTPLVNGQDITFGTEFGNDLNITGSGSNFGPVIFDSSNPGPNIPGQDLDLLLNQGNVLILQNDDPNVPAPVGGIYPRPNDDEDGGTLDFAFIRPVRPLSIDLLDIDNHPGEGAVLTLTDFSALTRTYTVPADWTGDLTLIQPGVGTLDLQTLFNQGGFNSTTATAAEDPGFDASAVVSLSVAMGGSGALDNLHIIIPCVQISFETKDDFTPIYTGTTLANGQDLSSPDEFNVEFMISDAGPNSGAAIFDSTPTGPNDPGPDNDLLVGLGNILCLQNNLFGTQTNLGFFDTPNDDTNGGDVFFDFPAPVHCHQIVLIDIDEEEVTGATVTLLDSGGKTRVFTCPPSWTEDLLNDGGPGFRQLDLDNLAAQPGFAASATAVEDPGFDPDEVIQMTVTFGGAQDMDSFCFCP